MKVRYAVDMKEIDNRLADYLAGRITWEQAKRAAQEAVTVETMAEVQEG